MSLTRSLTARTLVNLTKQSALLSTPHFAPRPTSSSSTASPPALKPPYNLDTATAMVKRAQDAWNTTDPLRVSKVYTPDAVWRNRTEQVSQGAPFLVESIIR